MTSIGRDAFEGCTSLLSISLPMSVTFIDEDALDDIVVYYPGTEEQADQICPTRCDWNCKHSHSVYRSGITVPSDCASHGYTADQCVYGEHFNFRDVLPPLGHELAAESVTEPTCTEQGYTMMACSRCAYKKRADFVEPLGHEVTVVGAVDPTCDVDGHSEGTMCSRCKEMLVGETIPALGHEIITDKAVEPTCTEPGLTEGSHCERCGAVTDKQEAVEARGHSWSATSINEAPTCTADGRQSARCTVCGAVGESALIPALGHASKKVTATSTVTAGSKCSRCNVILSGCKAKASQTYAKIATSTLTAKGLKSGKLKATKSFTLKSSQVRDRAKVTWSKSGKVGGSKIKVKGGKLYVYKGIKKGTYKVKVKMSIATSANYRAKTVYKTLKVVVK